MDEDCLGARLRVEQREPPAVDYGELKERHLPDLRRLLPAPDATEEHA